MPIATFDVTGKYFVIYDKSKSNIYDFDKLFDYIVNPNPFYSLELAEGIVNNKNDQFKIDNNIKVIPYDNDTELVQIGGIFNVHSVKFDKPPRNLLPRDKTKFINSFENYIYNMKQNNIENLEVSDKYWLNNIFCKYIIRDMYNPPKLLDQSNKMFFKNIDDLKDLNKKKLIIIYLENIIFSLQQVLKELVQKNILIDVNNICVNNFNKCTDTDKDQDLLKKIFKEIEDINKFECMEYYPE